ncbi:NBS-LRR type resistance protein [Cucumis melo var. makuwa]|uniref:NBS-LRR type resistance protein n=1 Tax=Cucumis melo var. makuwa TaxID=1194695 RepID=A0A5A7UV10_CUCMM|nr:NBS-LRR type resistance protein [Cucumis melo var. makuwa]TYK10988.1 NBS-LRR type resistance protein [Cucumis melo var. makuwa]
MNKAAQQKQPYNHSSGSKSFLQQQHELATTRIKCWNFSPSLFLRILSHSLGTRYVRLFWIDDRATQKVLVCNPSPSPAKR